MHLPFLNVTLARATEHAPLALYVIFSPKFVSDGRLNLLPLFAVLSKAKSPIVCFPNARRIGKITVTPAAVALPAEVTEIAHSPAPDNGVISVPVNAHAGANEA